MNKSEQKKLAKILLKKLEEEIELLTAKRDLLKWSLKQKK